MHLLCTFDNSHQIYSFCSMCLSHSTEEFLIICKCNCKTKMTGKKPKDKLQSWKAVSVIYLRSLFQVNRGLLSFRIHYLSKLADFAITLTQLAQPLIFITCMNTKHWFCDGTCHINRAAHSRSPLTTFLQTLRRSNSITYKRQGREVKHRFQA